MPESVYPQDRYPHYCIGYTTLFTNGTTDVFARHARMRTVKYLQDMWIDDVLFPGVFRVEVR